jgi:anti-sigma B factor antagonist
MPLNIRVDRDVVILSNLGRLMSDPRYVDAAKEARDILHQGFRKFVVDLGGVRETGSSFLGLLMTITRKVRQHGGELVLADLSREMEQFLGLMQMDEYWDVFDSVAAARRFFDGGAGKQEAQG